MQVRDYHSETIHSRLSLHYPAVGMSKPLSRSPTLTIAFTRRAMRSSRAIASRATFSTLLVLLGVLALPSATESSSGSITIFSDLSCTDVVVSHSGTIPLDTCIPASSTGNFSTNFIVNEKPFCEDGARPDLVLFEDPCCNGYSIANYIPNANYGDYGNGSCQHPNGAGFRALVFVCGQFQVPAPSIIAATFNFPSSPSQTSSTIPLECLAATSSTILGGMTLPPSAFPSSTTLTMNVPTSSRTSGSDKLRRLPPGVLVGIACVIALGLGNELY